MVNFGDNLKALRKQASMTQEELAKRLSVTKSVVSYYELRERTPSPEILAKLAQIFHTTTDHLLGVEHKKLIDVSDLSDDDVRLIMMIADTLRKKNKK